MKRKLEMIVYARSVATFVSEGEMDVRFSTADEGNSLVVSLTYDDKGGIRARSKPGHIGGVYAFPDKSRYFALSEGCRWEQVSQNNSFEDHLTDDVLLPWVETFATSQVDNIVAAIDHNDPATPETWERWLGFIETRMRLLGATLENHSHSRPSWRQVPGPVVVDTDKGPITLSFPDAERIVVGFPGDLGPGYPAGSIVLVPHGISWAPAPELEWDLSRVMHKFDRSPQAYVAEIILPAIGKVLHGLRTVRGEAVLANEANAKMARAEEGRILTYSHLNLQADLAHLLASKEAVSPGL